MTKVELISRNKKIVIGVLELIEVLPGNRVYDAMMHQLVRSSTSIGTNYRAACRAKSTLDFINKLKIVEKEADETEYFLDLMREIDKGNYKVRIESLLKEVKELVTIYVASIKTTRKNLQKKDNRKS